MIKKVNYHEAITSLALARWLRWLERRPVHVKGCMFDPWSGHYMAAGSISGWAAHRRHPIDVSLSSTVSLPPTPP